MVFISDPPSLKRLFAADRENTIAPGRNLVLKPVVGPRSLLLLEGDEHLRRRKLMLPPFHGERMRAYEAVMREATEREVASWPLDEPFALHPGMQAITLEVIMRAVFGVEDGGAARAARDAGRGARRDPLAGRVRAHDAGPATAAGLSPDRADARATDEILLAEIAERRADADLAEREDILSMLVAARFDDGEADGRRRAARPADDPAARGPRDDRDRARLGVRPAVSLPRQARALRAELGGGDG